MERGGFNFFFPEAMASAGVNPLDLNSQAQQEDEGFLSMAPTSEATTTKHLAAGVCPVPIPLAHRALCVCRTSVRGEGPAGRLEVY